MSSREQVRRFRPAGWTRVVTGLGAVVFPALAVYAVLAYGWSWGTAFFVMFGLVAILGFLDAMTSRVELHPDRLVIVSNLLRRAYPRADFTQVSWDKGCPVSLKTSGESWVVLPDLMTSGPGMASILRNWVRNGCSTS